MLGKCTGQQMNAEHEDDQSACTPPVTASQLKIATREDERQDDQPAVDHTADPVPRKQLRQRRGVIAINSSPRVSDLERDRSSLIAGRFYSYRDRPDGARPCCCSVGKVSRIPGGRGS